ncbi:helix-turn-helix domain-containing protein [Pontivivens ytuae]|uniref:DUF4115 domain-containing protein n=1 Tax=Pontivivens ytuae TaxID=2789856 RepID=A0A7S9QD99_9RHOB|nr:helix-turn-helix domain-containing protein [Pontivivens ytuae]QPH53916.1 DUF4115 domain-containing protein [Pontivivens ytuae]
MTLGDELRGERATKGKSLLDVQRDLRIKAAYIAAIESCDPDVFPNRGFIAGYVRSYARYLGLDPEEVYERFCTESGFSGVNAELTGRKSRKRGLQPAVQIDLSEDPLARARVGGPSLSGGIDLRATLGGLASLAVMVSLLGGVGYGGWRILQEIQRVELAPVAQAPIVEDRATALAEEGNAETAQPEAPIIAEGERIAALERLYTPARLDAPRLDPRDGPIASIDPASVSSFDMWIRPEEVAETPGTDPRPEVMLSDLTAAPVAVAETGPLLEQEESPILALEAVVEQPSGVAVVATQPAWVRVSQGDGATLFEKILAAGEVYDVPQDVVGPELRAGNSGAVFLRVSGQLYGPLGAGPRVAKNVSLVPDDILATFNEAELTDEQRAALAGQLPAGDETALSTQ